MWDGGESWSPAGRERWRHALAPVPVPRLDDDRQLLLASDNGAYLREAVGDLAGDLSDEGLTEWPRRWTHSSRRSHRRPACRSSRWPRRTDHQAAADQLAAAAGEVDALTGFAMAAEPDGTVLVALAFENEDQARRNADSRAALAAGPAPGQGGAFSDRSSSVR